MVRSRLPAVALALFAAVTLVACSVTLNFPLKKTVDVVFTGSAIDQSKDFDLNEQQEVRDHKAKVQELRIEKATVQVIAKRAGNTVTSLNGTFKLKGAGRTVTVGELQNFAIEPGTRKDLPGNDELDRLLTDVVKGDGKLTAILVGTGNGNQADFTVSYEIDVALVYNVF